MRGQENERVGEAEGKGGNPPERKGDNKRRGGGDSERRARGRDTNGPKPPGKGGRGI